MARVLYDCKCTPSKLWVQENGLKIERFKVYARDYGEAISIAMGEIEENYGEDSRFWSCDCDKEGESDGSSQG